MRFDTLVIKTLSPRDYVRDLPNGALATPLLLIDMDILERDFQAFLDGFPGTRILYAVKANPHPAILRKLLSMGSNFEISSVGELRLLKQLGIPGSRIISSNPVKTSTFIAEGSASGMTHFAFDSVAEVDKLATLAPGAHVSIRINVPNTGSDWPLDKKFGVDNDEGLFLLGYAREKGLNADGVTFHVGSQCRALESWRYAMGVARDLWDQCARRGINLDIVNVGGGMPIVYDRDDIPSIRAVGETVLQARHELFPPEVKLWLEPGRAVIGRAGVMVCSVIGVANRQGRRWVFLDTGVFHGMAEALGGIKYRYIAYDREGPEEPCTIAGPSCDSMDVLTENAKLPPVRTGDIVLIPACGAYTSAYSSGFNGFPGPEIVILNGRDLA